MLFFFSLRWKVHRQSLSHSLARFWANVQIVIQFEQHFALLVHQTKWWIGFGTRISKCQWHHHQHHSMKHQSWSDRKRERQFIDGFNRLIQLLLNSMQLKTSQNDHDQINHHLVMIGISIYRQCFYRISHQCADTHACMHPLN